MTRDEILKMEAGFQIDELVSSWIMKTSPGIKYWSSDIAAAWEVVEKMRGCNLYSFEVGSDQLWVCSMGRGEVEAPSAPLAICRAALLVIVEAK